MIGTTPDADRRAAVDAEASSLGDFMRLDLVEGYADLPKKTVAFLSAALREFPARFYLKVDDDVFVRVPALLAAASSQWAPAGRDYVGCMKRGDVLSDPKYRWYEPAHQYLGTAYFTHAWGSAYVLSHRAALALASIPRGTFRQLANEDTTIGLWMLSLNATFLDERRLCSPECKPGAIGIFDYPKCAGLCDPVQGFARLAADPACIVSEDEQKNLPEWKRFFEF